MRAPALFGIIVLIHATAIGLFSLMQGCATRRPGEGMAGSSTATERASTDTTGPGATLPAATVTSPGLPGTPPPPKRSDTKPVTPPKPALVTHATHVTPTKTPVVTAPKKALPKEGTPYEIKSGDVLSKIAASYGVSTLELASYNGLSNPGAIRKGQKIMIPPGATKKPAATVTASTLSGTPAAAPAAAPVAAAPALKADEYKVQSGDILGRIAARHGVSTSALKKANNLTSDSLKVGTILKIPAATPATPAAKPAAPDATPVLTPVLPATPTVVTPPPPVHPAPGTDAEVAPAPAVVTPATPVSSDLSKPFEYVVPDNESLDDIARMFIVTPDSIRKLNSLGPTEAVKAGQRIKIPPSQY